MHAEKRPSIRDFLDLAHRIVEGGPKGFWACESAFRKLVQSTALSKAASSEIQSLAEHPMRDGPWLQNEWQLHRDRKLALSVAMIEKEHRYIHVMPHYAMIAPLGSEPLVGQRYRLPEGFRNDVFDPSVRLIPDGDFSVERGEVLCVHSDTHAYDIRIRRPVLIARFIAISVLMQEWLFHRDNHSAWQANDADLSFTQLRVSADVLGRFAHQSSEGALKQMATHPHHAVRWAAIQNLGRLNRTAAVALLKDAVSDSHPHIRSAAQKTLTKIQGRGGG